MISVHNWSTNPSSGGLFYLFRALGWHGWNAATVKLFERQLSVHLERKVWRCFIPSVFTNQVSYNCCWRTLHQRWHSLLAHCRTSACRSLFQVSSTTDDGQSSTNCCLCPDTVISCVFMLSITGRAFMHGDLYFPLSFTSIGMDKWKIEISQFTALRTKVSTWILQGSEMCFQFWHSIFFIILYKAMIKVDISLPPFGIRYFTECVQACWIVRCFNARFWYFSLVPSQVSSLFFQFILRTWLITLFK